MTSTSTLVSSRPRFRQLTLDKQPQVVFLSLSIVALVTRLPYFFDAVIDWDESTFILIGQSVLDGHLPYTELLDLKPPLVWVSFALFILILGKSVVSIRLAGTICVAFTAFMTYLIGRKIWNGRIGFLAGSLFIIVTGLMMSGQSVMSEHVALVPLMASLTLLITRRNTAGNLFLAGGAIAVASLIRLNLAYSAIAVGLAIMFYPPTGSIGKIRSILYRGFAYALGGIAIVLLTILPYAIVGKQQIWWTGVVTASLTYAQVQQSFWETFLEQLTIVAMISIDRASIASLALLSIFALVWLGGLLQVLLTPIGWRRLDSWQKRSIFLLVVALVSIEVSILKGGVCFPHYLLQLNSILSLFAAVLIGKLLSTRLRPIVVSGLAIILIVIALNLSSQYKLVKDRITYNRTPFSGSAYEVANFLKRENPDKEPILLLNQHLAYWLTDTKPINPVMTHPSNINREFLLKAWLGEDASSATELSKTLAQQPKFIIGDSPKTFFSPPIQAQFDRAIAENYISVDKVAGVEVYKRVR